MVKKLKSPRRLAALAIFAVIAVSAFGFAAQNTFSGTDKAGNGTHDISGFAISGIGYGIQDSNAAYLDEVHFTTDTAAGEVLVRFSDGAATPTYTAWFPCTESGTSVSCAITANTVAILNAETLEVSAVS